MENTFSHINMLRLVLLVGSFAQVSIAGVANACVQAPYNQIQEFRDYSPARDSCSAHFPAQTLISTLPPRCLTTTSTVILGTSTVTATSSEACPTEAPLQRRDADDELLKRAPAPGKSSKAPLPSSKPAPSSKPPPSSQPPPESSTTTKIIPPPSPSKSTSSPESEFAVPTDKRDVVRATPVKRDAMATKSAEWDHYLAGLLQCGYDCVQTACSCIAATKVEYKTPVPTCTETKTKSTTMHVTTTIVVSAQGCKHDDLRKA